MSPNIQLAISASDPHALADFWAAALGLVVHVDEQFVKMMIEQGQASEADTTTHNGFLTWADGAAATDPEGRLPRMYFQRSDDEKLGHNRLHLDVQVGADQRDAEVERLIGLGASRLWEGSQGPHQWVTLGDPEGNEFCVS